MSYPDAPGPPGLTRSEPSLAPVARFRINANSMAPCAGRCQFSGAVTVAHSKPSLHADHATRCAWKGDNPGPTGAADGAAVDVSDTPARSVRAENGHGTHPLNTVTTMIPTATPNVARDTFINDPSSSCCLYNCLSSSSLFPSSRPYRTA